MMLEITRQMLRDYLNNALPEPELVAVEKAMRDNPEIRELLQEVREQIDLGEHSLGAIWRREHLSCPTRDELGSYLLGACDPGLESYIEFHLNIIGCPICLANRDDLQQRNAEPEEPVRRRRKRIVDSSVQELRKFQGS
jgi:hypothetical protein